MLHSPANSRVKRPQDFGYKKPPKQRFKGWPGGGRKKRKERLFLVLQRNGGFKRRRNSACLLGEKKVVFVIREEGVPRAFVFSLCNFCFG